MATTFEDNTEVTLADLNNIGVDLGDTDFNAFSTEKFGVDKLNQITSDLVSSGVLRIGENGELGCEVIASNDMAYIQPGAIVFGSGAKIRITEPVGVSLLPGTVIYALNNPATGRASIDVSETLPDGDCVLLAQVDAEGILSDRRSSCVAKVLMTADPQNIYREITATIEDVYYETKEITVDIGSSAFSYVYFLGTKRVATGVSNGTAKYVAVGKNAVFLEDEEKSQIDIGRNAGTINNSLYFKKEGQFLTISVYNGSLRADFEISIMIM